MKGGKIKAGIPRYKCLNVHCPHDSFQLDLISKGRCPALKEYLIDMALNGSGIRDTVRGLKISPTTLLVRLAADAAVDERWSFVGKKREPRWLWHA